VQLCSVARLNWSDYEVEKVIGDEASRFRVQGSQAYGSELQGLARNTTKRCPGIEVVEHMYDA
jgi:hypothetical protein